MHQIWFDKYMKSQSIRNSISANFHPKKERKISSSCLVTMMSSADSILAFLHRQLRYNFWRHSVPFLCYFVPCRCFLLPFYAILSPCVPFYTFFYAFLLQNQKYAHFSGGEVIEKLSKADRSAFF